MIIKFKNADNGCIMEVTGHDAPGSVEYYVYQENVDGTEEIERFRDFLWVITDALGPTTNRYSEKRIRISIEPGDKYGDGTDTEI